MMKLTLPVDVHRVGVEHFANLRDAAGKVLLCAIISNANSAKTQLREQIMAQLREQIMGAIAKHCKTMDSYRTRVFGCGTGAVFVVGWDHFSQSWQYRICGPDRTHSSVTLGSMPDFQTACDRAREHAVGNFGGILWENS